MRKALWILAVLLLPACVAEAHYLWIETPSEEKAGEPAKVYYGEFEEGAREVSPGRLDSVTEIEAWTTDGQGGGTNVSLEKQAEYFTADLPQDASGLLQLQETEREVVDFTKYDIGIVKPSYYASALLPGAEPGLIPQNKTELAIYPLELGEQARVKVFFRGEPLKGAKVKLHAPNTWSKEIKAGEDGTASFSVPWPGRYVFEVIYPEKTPGEFKGVPYEAVRHRATFSWENEGPAAAEA